MCSFVSRFITGLYAKGNATIDQIQNTVQSSAEMHSSTVQHIKDLFKKLTDILPYRLLQHQCVTDLNQYLECSSDVFRGYETEYMRKKHLESVGLILPVSHKIGDRNNVEADGSTVKVPVYAQYVSIIDTLKSYQMSPKPSLILHPPLLRRFEDTATYKQDEYYREHPDAMRLTLYHDDIECGNSLGSKAGINKLTMFYMTINDTMSDMATKGKLSAIHLVLVCHSSDIVEHGYENVLQPLVTDLRILYDGHLVAYSENNHPTIIHAKLEHLVGDNLAANQILGLVTSFNKTHYCRFCYISGENAAGCVSACNIPIRTSTTHQLDVEMTEANPLSFKNTGVKSRCALDEISYFSGVESTVPDIM